MRYFSPIAGAALLLLGSAGQADDLLHAYRLAVDSDPQLHQALEAARAVSESSRQARARLLPQAGFDASINRTRSQTLSSGTPFFSESTYYFTTRNYSLSLSQAVYRRDYFTLRDQADAQAAQAEAELDAARQALIVRVAERYFSVLGARDNLEFARTDKDAIARQLDQTRSRFEVGLIAITDVHEAQAAYDLAVAQEIAAENQLAVAREALREVTGEPVTDLKAPGPAMALPSPDPLDVAAWIADALEHNPQLAASRFAVEAAREAMEVSRSARFPQVDAVASMGYTDSGGSRFGGGSESTDAVIGLQLSVPLYRGGGIQSAVREAGHRLNQAKEAAEQQRRATERQTRDAYLSVLSSISRVKALKQATVSGRSALAATEAGFEVGTRTIVDVLQAQRKLYGAQRDYARARYDFLLNTLRLKQATGLLAENDVAQINAMLEAPPD
ncbi:MAG TPA: type I secretion protein TolC [Gammaproteobacteria bacterium]|nr:type I secretion protein TolC [Gammaproteobacteria bacterium]